MNFKLHYWLFFLIAILTFTSTSPSSNVVTVNDVKKPIVELNDDSKSKKSSPIQKAIKLKAIGKGIVKLN